MCLSMKCRTFVRTTLSSVDMRATVSLKLELVHPSCSHKKLSRTAGGHYLAFEKSQHGKDGLSPKESHCALKLAVMRALYLTSDF